MDAYLYRAALYCDWCIEEIKADLGYALEGQPEQTYDSDEYPKGPFANGGGEADYPAHCDACGAFLENPLTNDGYDYVREAVELLETDPDRAGDPMVLAEWREFYQIRLSWR